MDKAFELSHNLDHIKANQDYDVWQIFKDRKERFHKLFWRLEPFDELPSHRFEGKIKKRLSWLDYPRVDPDYPIVSKKMLDTLLSVDEFSYVVKPLIIYDCKLGKTMEDFVFLHLLEQLDILDKENSLYYGKLKIAPSQAALKEPRGGYPPLFRVKDAGLNWFVSEEAKEALEEADIKGLRFVPLIYPETTVKYEK